MSVSPPSVSDISYLDTDLEDKILRACFGYEKFLAIIKPALSSSDFSTRIKAELYEHMIKFHNQYKLPVKSLEFLYELEKTCRSDSLKLVQATLKRILDIPCPDWDWIIKKSDESIRLIKLLKAIYEVRQMPNKSYDLIMNKLSPAIRRSGLAIGQWKNDLNLSTDEISAMIFDKNDLICKTRIPDLDYYIKGIYRNELFVILAPFAVGKSWAGVHFVRTALLSRRYVLHFSLEMTRKATLKRVMQSFSGTYKPENDSDYDKIVKVWDKGYTNLLDYKASSLLNVEAVKVGLDCVKRYGGKLVVKEAPSRTMSLDMLRSDIERFDLVFNKLPDLVIIDGVTDLVFPSIKKGDTVTDPLEACVRGLAAIAKEYSLGIVFTHQANRQALGAKVVTASHASKSISSMQVPDVAISISVDSAEKAKNEARIKLLRAREHEYGALMKIKQNIKTGQFCMASAPLDKFGNVIEGRGFRFI